MLICLFVLQDSQWRELLESLHTLNIPDPGVPVHLSVVIYSNAQDKIIILQSIYCIKLIIFLSL